MIGAVAYLLATISSTVVIRLSQQITDFLEEFQTKFLSCQMCVLQPDRFGARKSAFLSFETVLQLATIDAEGPIA